MKTAPKKNLMWHSVVYLNHIRGNTSFQKKHGKLIYSPLETKSICEVNPLNTSAIYFPSLLWLYMPIGQATKAACRVHKGLNINVVQNHKYVLNHNRKC